MLLKGLNKDERKIIWRKLSYYDFEMMKMAINGEYNPPRTKRIALIAARHNHFDLLEKYQDIPYQQIMIGAGYGGHKNIIKWIFEKVLNG
jgi:hypothetical protein